MTILTVCLFTFFGWAQAPKAPEIPACTALVKKCAAKGFEATEAATSKKKNVWLHCIAARAAGAPVDGVSFTPDEARKCLEAVKGQYKGHGH